MRRTSSLALTRAPQDTFLCERAWDVEGKTLGRFLCEWCWPTAV